VSRRHRRLAIAAGVAVLFAIGGCGDDDGGSKSSAFSDRVAITAQVQRYYAALAAGNGEAACEVLTAQAAKGFEAVLNGPVASDCRANVETLSRASLLRGRPQVTGVNSTGEQATAHVTFERPQLESDLVLVNEHGVWKLSQIPAVLGPTP
jgi:hypothetical protein